MYPGDTSQFTVAPQLGDGLLPSSLESIDRAEAELGLDALAAVGSILYKLVQGGPGQRWLLAVELPHTPTTGAPRGEPNILL
jgi:hypothetical protein